MHPPHSKRISARISSAVCPQISHNAHAPNTPAVLAPTWRSECGRVELHLGDCLALMPRLPASIADAIVTDPPYILGVGGSSGKGCFAKTTGKFRGGDLLKMVNGFDVPTAFGAWDRLLRRKSVFCFCSNKQIAELMTVAKAVGWSPTLLVWWKSNAVPFTNGTWRPDIEYIVHARGPGAAMNGSAVLKRKVKHMAGTRGAKSFGHPTCKPLPLIRDYVLIGSDADNTVLDPYMGSGTTGVACVQQGRRFIGIEREEKFFATAVERCQAALAELDSARN